jgi:hypothetical protein
MPVQYLSPVWKCLLPLLPWRAAACLNTETGQTMSETPGPGEFAFESVPSGPAAYDAAPPAGVPDGVPSDAPAAGPPSSPPDLRTVTRPAPVLVSFAGPQKQARLTVAFRALLVVPQFIALWLFSIVAGVVAFLGWWAAVVTGDLPQWARGLLTSYVRWSARVGAYAHFLTDEYPPFDSEDGDYPVRLLTKPTRLNRAAVFFRFFLLLPAGLVAVIAAFGLVVLSPIAWIIALVTGRMPMAWHQAFAATIRFTARCAGYAYLITPDYPRGLYGDKPAAAAQAPGPWQLLMSRGAKVLVTVSLVLSLAVGGGCIALIAVLSANAANSAQARLAAYVTLRGDYDTVNAVFENSQTQSQRCNGKISCITGQDKAVAAALGSFRGGIQHAGVPSAYTAQVRTAAADATAVAADFRQLGTAQSTSQYETIVAGLSVQADLDLFLAASSTLLDSLYND